jgi:hypothetical protein
VSDPVILTTPGPPLRLDVFLTAPDNVTDEHLDDGWRWCWVSEVGNFPIPWRSDTPPPAVAAVVAVHQVIES